MQEQDERLCLESLILELVPRNQKDRLVGLVVVEPNRFLGASDIPGSSSSWYIFTRQADLPEPGDEGSPTLGDQAVLQHL